MEKKMSIYYLSINNTDNDDVTLFKFRDRGSAFNFIHINDIVEFILTDIVDQNGIVSGFEPEDYETIISEKS